MRLHPYVVVQMVLILALGWLGVAAWPWGWVRFLVFVAGCAVMGIAALNLGASLTPNPEPNQAGLRTGGFYRWVRHPIYLGVLVCAGAVGSTGWLAAMVFLGVVALLVGKIQIEERMLLETYPSYREYAKNTKRLIPWVW